MPQARDSAGVPWWLVDIFTSLLPARYRERWQMDPVRGAQVSGVLQIVIAFVVYATLFFRYLNTYGALSGSAMASPGAAGQNVYWTSFGLGAIGWLAFTITPGPLLSMYVMIEGTVRLLAATVTHEPLPSLPFWLVALGHSYAERARERRQLAPPAPDLVEAGEPGCGWDLRVTSTRPKTEWRSLVQIEYNGEYYQLVSGGRELVDGVARFRYFLKKAAAASGFRGVVHYDPFQVKNEE